MKGILSTTLTVFVSLVLSNTAKAAIINGDFENGFNGWQTIGDSRVEGTQAFLSNAFNEVVSIDANGREIRSGNAVPATFITGVAENSLEGFLGLSQFFGDNSLGQAIEGSAIGQTFTAQAGQTLSFAWNFLTDESTGSNADPNYNDFAFATISNNSENLFFRLADTTGDLTNSSSQNFFAETGFKTFSYTLPTNGEYTLGIGVVDVGERTVISGLFVDRVQAQAVPETSSAVTLLILGMGGVSVLKGSRKRQNY
ncbi:hypothetical protein [Iningainema tapete]|uniref:PEP-CTERM sorting domain-containing protein n=1 Tax=Iningainema tapete BLCC-T55 TaxID=2748662 RepID=A0A8J7C4Z6_9CYAN|nr:hypothetical protein [Iningainema tapete]MBD2772319.1 hypothetical protein [Iningainema tapete BLCC-T55]